MDIEAHIAALSEALLRNDGPAIVAALEALEQLVPSDELTELVAPLLDQRTLLSLALVV